MANFPFDIVGFDIDGTLLDSHADIGNALNHALAIIGRAAIPIAECRGMIGGGARQLLEKALAATGGPLPPDVVKIVHQELLDFYAANIAVHSRLFPGGAAMLDGLAARGVKLAVVSNKLEALTRQVLDELRLSDRFFTIIGGDTLGPGRAKPARDLIDLMVERGGGGRAAYVGDTAFDTGAAKAAGLPCVAVSFGFNDLPPEDLGADAVIAHFDELIPVLEKL